MIESISVANFKVFGPRRVELKLAPLTLLVGRNGTGKSTLLEALALLAQSVRPSGGFGLQLEKGRLVPLGRSMEAVYHARRSAEEMHLGLRWRPEEALTIGCWLTVRGASTPFDGSWAQGLSLRAAGSEVLRGILGTSVAHVDEEDKIVESEVRFSRETVAGGAATYATCADPDDRRRFAVFGEVRRVLDEGLFSSVQPDPEVMGLRWVESWRSHADRLAEFLSGPRLRYLSALRGGSLVSYEAKGSPTSSGRYGEDSVRLLSLIQSQVDRAKKDRLERLAARFGMGQFAAGWSGEQRLAANFTDSYTGASLPIAHAGFGSQQVLPLIADMVEAPAGTTIMVEEIEHSCHPEWVKALGITMAEQVRDGGIQLLATTHAPDLALAVSIAVRQGILPAEAVAVYEFSRDEGGVSADRLGLDARGHFEPGWIQTFAAAERELLADLFDSPEPPVAGSGSSS